MNVKFVAHLGNTRATFAENTVDPRQAELLKQNHYYPFGQEFGGDFVRGEQQV